jgi:hypothetical protein
MGFTRGTRLLRMLTSWRALRLLLALPLLAVLLLTVGLRVHSYLLTRKIQAVLSGLERLRMDRTSEQELLKTVPYVVRQNFEGHTSSGTERSSFYQVRISNEDEILWLFRVLSTRPFQLLWPWHAHEGAGEPWTVPLRGAYWLGFRYVEFGAWVHVVDGRVSNIDYVVDRDMLFGWPLDPLVSVRSAHGFWERHLLLPVTSADDESPRYRVSGDAKYLLVAYTPDAPRDLVQHAFHLDLSCFWDLRGCALVRDVAPLLWRDKQVIDARTVARLQGRENPCPDSVLAGRVRTLPDLNVYLLEAIGSGRQASDAPTKNYRLLKEVLRGHADGSWTDIAYERFMRPPANPAVAPFLKPGDRVLAFTGARFESCGMVPDTPSAEAAVRTAVPPPRRREDDRLPGLGGRM